MKEDFLRRPVTFAEWAADALRIMGVLGVVAAAIWLQPTDAGIAALALPALMLPRMLGVRAWFDVTACILVLVAAWSNVFDLYTTVAGWDLLLHCLCTAALSVIAALILNRTKVAAITLGSGAPARSTLVLMPLIALAISAIWEMIEWAGWAYITRGISVGYQDTITDMIAGGVGGILAGILLTRVSVERGPRGRSRPTADDVPDAEHSVAGSS